MTANNAVADADYPYLIATVFAHGYRAQRSVDMIEDAPGLIDSAYIQSMQGDNLDLNAETLVPILLEVPVGIENETYRDLLVGWDYQAHMNSPAAAMFEVFWKNLLELTFLDELPQGTEPDGGSRWFEVFADLVERPDDAWWDIPTTTPVEDRDFIFNMAFTAAVNELKVTLGEDAEQWTWGDLHTLNLVNQSLGNSGIGAIDALFNRGGYRISGGTAIVNATGWGATKDEPYAVRSLPSMRMIVDLDRLENSLTMHTTGQSGHAYHEHYVDMADPWRQIEYKGMLWDPEQVEAEASAHLELAP